jgi:hypothetical protein
MEIASRPKLVAGIGFLLLPEWRYIIRPESRHAVGHEPVSLDLMVENIGARTARNVYIEAFFHLPVRSTDFASDARHNGTSHWLIEDAGTFHPRQRRSFSVPIEFAILNTDFEAIVRLHYDDSPPAEFTLLLGATDDMTRMGATWRRFDLKLFDPQPMERA